MKKSQIISQALISALSTSIYVMIVALFMYFGNQGFLKEIETIFIPIIMLMLFVFSAALTGFLMLGKPIMWYFDGKKKEAWSLFFYTLGFFFIITLIILLIFILI